MTALVRYDTACRALAEAKAVDEVLDIRDKAEALRAYGRIAKNRVLEVDAAEIRMRAERRIGELMAQQRATAGLAKPGGDMKSDHRVRRGPDDPPPLAAVGIDKHLADRARKLAAVPKPEFESAITEWRQQTIENTEKVTANLLKKGERHIRGTFGTGENEWYTPEKYIRYAHEVLGAIDLDPASTSIANEVIKAAKYFSIQDNGLEQEWSGTVWLNPPYAQPHIALFVSKMVADVRSGRIVHGIMLTHNYTDTSWFHEAASVANAICFTKGRIGFLTPENEIAAPTQGQAFFYYGADVSEFCRVFSACGFVMVPPKHVL